MEQDGWQAGPPLIESRWDEFVRTDPQVLLEAIKSLPGEALVASPSLLTGADYLQHLVTGADAKVFRRSIDRDLADHRGVDGLRERLVSLTGRSAERRTKGHINGAVELVTMARAILEKASDDDSTQLRTTLPHLMIQWARTLDVADSARAFPEYEMSYDLARVTGQHNIARRAAGCLAWMYADRGSIAAATRWLGRARATGSPDQRYDIVQSLTAMMLAVYALDAEQMARHGAVADTLDVGEYWAANIWVRSLQVHNAEAAVVTHQFVEREVARHPASLAIHGANHRYIVFTRARLSMLMGTHPVTYDVDEFDQGTRNEFQAFVAYRRSDYREALQTGGARLTIGDEGATPRQCSTLLLIWAGSRLRLGRENAAVDAFRRAVAIIEHEGMTVLYALLRIEDLRELNAKSGHLLPVAIIERLGFGPVPRGRDLPSLTARELQMLAMLMSHRTNSEIAEEMFVSANTMKSLQRRLYRKLDVHSRVEAVDLAHHLGVREP